MKTAAKHWVAISHCMNSCSMSTKVILPSMKWCNGSSMWMATPNSSLVTALKDSVTCRFSETQKLEKIKC